MEPLFPQLGFLPGERELRVPGGAALQLLQDVNPMQGLNNAMFYAGQAANPEVSPEERRSALGESALESGLFLIPGAAGLLGRYLARSAPRVVTRVADEVGDVVETLTAARPDAPQTADAEFEAELDRIFGPAPQPLNIAEEEFLDQPPRIPDDADIEEVGFENDWPFDIFNEDLPDQPGDDGNILDTIVNEFDDLNPIPQQTGLRTTLGTAALDLEQPRYGSYEEVISNLRRLGAKSPEIEASGIRSLMDVEGPITKDMIEEAVSADNPLQVQRFGANTNRFGVYSPHFTQGGENYREVVITSPTGLGAFEEGAEGFAPGHFPTAGPNQIVHYRAAEFPVIDSAGTDLGKSFHIGEVQSDWAQDLRANETLRRIAQMEPEEAARWYQDNVEAPYAEYDRLLNEQGRVERVIYGLEEGEPGLSMEDYEDMYQNLGERMNNLRPQMKKSDENNGIFRQFWVGDPNSFERFGEMTPEEAQAFYRDQIEGPEMRYSQLREEEYEIIDKLDGNLQAFYDGFPTLSDEERIALQERRNWLRTQIDQNASDAAYQARRTRPKFFTYWQLDNGRLTRRPDVSGPFIREGAPTPDPLPRNAVVNSTNDVTRLALRQALLDAANTDAQYVTLGTGDMAVEMTGGQIEGQRKYYDEILPRQMREVFRRLGNEYGIEMPEITQMDIRGSNSAYTVPGFVMTDELRNAILEEGISMFKTGGMVNLKSGLASMAREVL